MKRLKALILAMIIAAAGWWYFGQPAKGKITVSKDSQPRPTVALTAVHQGEYLQFEYENKYRIENTENNDMNVLENVHLVGNTGIGSEIVVTLKTETAGKLDDVPGVTLRQLKNDIYKEEAISWGETEGKLFEDNEGNSAAFFIKDGRLMSTAITRGTKNELKKLIENLTWVK